jgi:hypothetical protein
MLLRLRQHYKGKSTLHGIPEEHKHCRFSALSVPCSAEPSIFFNKSFVAF